MHFRTNGYKRFLYCQLVQSKATCPFKVEAAWALHNVEYERYIRRYLLTKLNLGAQEVG